ncbi:MAG TPA: hypothetical protein VGP82_24320, partial [Ktedonobacterales bacterium]|nr:hypothetical protein [Ktedonobacterales bacterium]
MSSPTLSIASLRTDFDFGYLDTTANHDTWFTILNQNDTALDVTIDYYKADGTKLEKVHQDFVAPNSRGSLKVNTEGLPAGTYSAHVHCDQPALIERPMYFKDASTGRPGITDVLG